MAFSLDELSRLAAGVTSLEQFRGRVIAVLLEDGPHLDESGSPVFPLMHEWATDLDMVCDPDDPNFHEPECRRLASAMCAILDQIPEDDIRSKVTHFARWAPKTVRRLREYGAGGLSREALERFVARRPWPDDHKRAVSALDDYDLARFADALESNDYGAVVTLFGS